MSQLIHTATFAAADALDRMLEDIACPACGYRDPADTYRLTPGNRVRFFCDGCGAFVTIVLSEAQADAVRHWSSTVAARGSGDSVAGAQDLDRA